MFSVSASTLLVNKHNIMQKMAPKKLYTFCVVLMVKLSLVHTMDGHGGVRV